jgi:hypothetical protein
MRDKAWKIGLEMERVWPSKLLLGDNTLSKRR